MLGNMKIWLGHNQRSNASTIEINNNICGLWVRPQEPRSQ